MPVTKELWERKQSHYQKPEVAEGYDSARFNGKDCRKDRVKWKAMQRVLGDAWPEINRVLDLPSGTARFTARWLDAGKQIFNADLSLAMLNQGVEKIRRMRSVEIPTIRSCATTLPFADDSFDLVTSIRFLMHVPYDIWPTILREYARVSTRWVLVDVRHPYAIGHVSRKVRKALRVSKKEVRDRISLARLSEIVDQADLKIARKVWISPGFSEKLIVLCEPK